MAKGNRSNHPKTYARQEDLLCLKVKMETFLENDWPHHAKDVNETVSKIRAKVARQEGVLWVVALLLGTLLAKGLGVF